MNPHRLKLEWLEGGFQLNGDIHVEADAKEFVIPVRLTPGREQKLVLNRDREAEMRAAPARRRRGAGLRPTPEGFLDANAVAANEFRWSFTTKAPVATPGAPKPRS